MSDGSGSWAFEADFSQAMALAAVEHIARDLVVSLGSDEALPVLEAALADAGLDLDAREIIDGVSSGPSFTGSEQLDQNGGTIGRRGTLTFPDGSRRYIIERADATGVLQPILDRAVPGPQWLDREDLAGVDWAAVATQLKHEVRALWPVTELEEDLGYPPSPADALSLARSATGGAVSLLAGLAYDLLGWEHTEWSDVDDSIDQATDWGVVIEDPYDDVRHIVELVQAGVTTPDRAALAARRNPVNHRMPDLTRAFEDDGYGLDDVLTVLPGETAVDRGPRAAKELGLPAGAVAWAYTGKGLGAITSIDGGILMWTRHGPVVIDGDSGEVVTHTLGGDAAQAHEVTGTGDLVLVDDYRTLAACTSEGTERWRLPFSDTLRIDGNRALLREGGNLVADPTTVRCVDLATGAVAWTRHGTSGRPGLWPIGFAGDLALLGRRDNSRYWLEAIDPDGAEVGRWETHNGVGRVSGGWVVVGEQHTRIDDLLGTGPVWRDRPTPAAEDGSVWVDGDDFHPWRVGFGTGSAPDWMVTIPDMVDRDTRPAGSGWIAAGGRRWAQTHRQTQLIGVGEAPGDVVTVELPLWRGRPVAAGPAGLVIRAEGRSGGDWLTCLRADVLAGTQG